MKLYQKQTGQGWIITDVRPVENKEDWSEHFFTDTVDELFWWLKCASRQAYNSRRLLDVALELNDTCYYF